MYRGKLQTSRAQIKLAAKNIFAREKPTQIHKWKQISRDDDCSFFACLVKSFILLRYSVHCQVLEFFYLPLCLYLAAMHGTLLLFDPRRVTGGCGPIDYVFGSSAGARRSLLAVLQWGGTTLKGNSRSYHGHYRRSHAGRHGQKLTTYSLFIILCWSLKQGFWGKFPVYLHWCPFVPDHFGW